MHWKWCEQVRLVWNSWTGPLVVVFKEVVVGLEMDRWADGRVDGWMDRWMDVAR